MNAESSAVEIRVRQFDREFPRIVRREHYLTMYLALRDGGDDHTTASETVRGEREMSQRMTAAEHNAFPGGRWGGKGGV